MVTAGPQHSTQIDQRWPVQLQRSHGCSTRFRDAFDVRGVFVPTEMLRPLLPPRMKQRHDFSTQRIGSSELDCFVTVAPGAGIRQVIQQRGAAQSARDDVLHDKWRVREALLALAIFAAMPRSITDNCAHSNRDTPLRSHRFIADLGSVHPKVAPASCRAAARGWIAPRPALHPVALPPRTVLATRRALQH